MWLTEALPELYLRKLSGVVVSHAGHPLETRQGGAWRHIPANGRHRSQGPEVGIPKLNAGTWEISLPRSRSLWLQNREKT